MHRSVQKLGASFSPQAENAAQIQPNEGLSSNQASATPVNEHDSQRKARVWLEGYNTEYIEDDTWKSNPIRARIQVGFLVRFK